MIEIVESKDYNLIADMNKEVQSLHHKLYPEIFKPYEKSAVTKFFREVLFKENVKAYIALDSEKVLGYVLLFEIVHTENPFQYERKFIILDQILVLEQARSKGVGKLLIQKTVSYAKSLQMQKVELNHWTLNESARIFFNKNGFKYFNEKMALAL